MSRITGKYSRGTPIQYRHPNRILTMLKVGDQDRGGGGQISEN